MRANISSLLFSCLLPGLLVTAACTSPQKTTPATPTLVSPITGSVTYRERIALTPTAEVTVKLLDVSIQDVAAKELATVTIMNPGQVPIEFALDFDPTLVDERYSYNVRAEIRDRGKLIFTTDTAYPVLTRGAGTEVDLILKSASRAPEPAARLTGTYWKLVEAQGTAIRRSPGQPEAHMRLLSENSAIEGSSGCNNFAGTYTLAGETLKVGPLAMTMMACVEGMDTEQLFGVALADLNRYEISGNTLYGYADKDLVLKFEAR